MTPGFIRCGRPVAPVPSNPPWRAPIKMADYMRVATRVRVGLPFALNARIPVIDHLKTILFTRLFEQKLFLG